MTANTLDPRFLDLELAVEVWLAAENVRLSRLLELEPGGVLTLEHDPDGPVDLVVNGTTVATGELVVIDGRFGFRVSESSEQMLAELAPEDVRAAAETTNPVEGTEDLGNAAATKRIVEGTDDADS